MNVLLSIKPKYVNEILAGKKLFEFRKAIFKKKDIGKVFIYSSSPVKKIVASFEIARIIADSPQKLWDKCQKYGGIPKNEFFEYYQNSDTAYAIEISNLDIFSEPIDPYKLKQNFRPPQSYCYLPLNYFDDKYYQNVSGKKYETVFLAEDNEEYNAKVGSLDDEKTQITQFTESEAEKVGWTKATINELISNAGVFCDGDWIEKKDQDPDGNVRLIQLADIGDGFFKDKSNRFLTVERAKKLNCTFLEEGDIIVARMPDPIGRCCIFPLNGLEKYITAVDVAIIRFGNSSISRKYFMHILNSPQSRNSIELLQSGTTRKRISRKNLSTIEFPIPPLPEQRAIVSKIELLFSELDNGIANLKLAQEQLKVYRQAVLKKAFEGELTRKWREQQVDLPSAEELLEQIKVEREEGHTSQLDEWKKAVKKWEEEGKAGKKPAKPKKSKETKSIAETELSLLPKEWGWIRLGNLVEEPKYGTSKKCEYSVNGTGVLRIPNIADGLIDDSDLKYAQFDLSEIENYTLKNGDILIIRSNGSIDLVGKCALVRLNDEEHLYAGYLIRLRPIGSLINSKYLSNCLSSVDLRHQIESKAKSTSGVNNINSGELQSLILPICSPSEQQAIVSEIETRLSVCDKVEQDIAENLEKAEALRQSILKRAFEGKLLSERELEEVRKVEDWEPAEVLLERVKAERAISGKK